MNCTRHPSHCGVRSIRRKWFKPFLCRPTPRNAARCTDTFRDRTPTAGASASVAAAACPTRPPPSHTLYAGTGKRNIPLQVDRERTPEQELRCQDSLFCSETCASVIQNGTLTLTLILNAFIRCATVLQNGNFLSKNKHANRYLPKACTSDCVPRHPCDSLHDLQGFR